MPLVKDGKVVSDPYLRVLDDATCYAHGRNPLCGDQLTVYLKLGKPREAMMDYDSALRLNPNHASSLYGRGLAKVRSGDAAAGSSDIALAKKIRRDIAEEFSIYGVR